MKNQIFAVAAAVLSVSALAQPIIYSGVEIEPDLNFITITGVSRVPLFIGIKTDNVDNQADFSEVTLEAETNDLAGPCPDNWCRFEYYFKTTRFDKFSALQLKQMAEDPTLQLTRPQPINLKGKRGLIIKDAKKETMLGW